MSYRPYNQVKEYFVKNDHLIRAQPQPLPVEVMLLRQRLILEELGEVAIAAQEKDMEAFADGLCDLLYVLIGSCVSFGVPIYARLPDQPGLARWPPDVVITQYLHLITEAAARCITVIATNAMTVFTDRFEASNVETIREAFDKAIWRVNDLAAISGINLSACFTEVHRANMSKDHSGAGASKYGDRDPKGAGYQPPQLRGILGLMKTTAAEKEAV